MYGHDDYGTATNVIGAFSNPQEFYSVVAGPNEEIAAPVLGVALQLNGLFTVLIQLNGQMVEMRDVSPDKPVYEINEERWTGYLIANQ